MDTKTRKNPADPTRWNAWRFPTEAEIARGRGADDMFYRGSSATPDGAWEFLDQGQDGTWNGQIQHGLDGEVRNAR